MGDLSSLLFARPSFIGGMASILDIGDTLWEFNRSEGRDVADSRALRADMMQVGLDFTVAIEERLAARESQCVDR